MSALSLQTTDPRWNCPHLLEKKKLRCDGKTCIYSFKQYWSVFKSRHKIHFHWTSLGENQSEHSTCKYYRVQQINALFQGELIDIFLSASNQIYSETQQQQNNNRRNVCGIWKSTRAHWQHFCMKQVQQSKKSGTGEALCLQRQLTLTEATSVVSALIQHWMSTFRCQLSGICRQEEFCPIWSQQQQQRQPGKTQCQRQ